MPTSPFTRTVDAVAQARDIDDERHQAWCESRNYAALFDALHEASGDAGADDVELVRVPRWVVRGATEATLEALNAARAGRKGPNASWPDRHVSDQWDLMVYEFVQRQLDRGLSRADAIAAADVFFCGRVTPKGIEHTLKRVADGLIDEPGRYYVSKYLQQRDALVTAPRTDEDLALRCAEMGVALQKRRVKKRQRIRAARSTFSG